MLRYWLFQNGFWLGFGYLFARARMVSPAKCGDERSLDLFHFLDFFVYSSYRLDNFRRQRHWGILSGNSLDRIIALSAIGCNSYLRYFFELVFGGLGAFGLESRVERLRSEERRVGKECE